MTSHELIDKINWHFAQAKLLVAELEKQGATIKHAAFTKGGTPLLVIEKLKAAQKA